MSAEHSVELDGGKYTVRHTSGGNFHALRYGEPWRDLTGDGLILSLVQRIEELEAGRIEADERVVPVDATRASLVKALMAYRCIRTVDEDGEPLPLVDALSPGEGGTIQFGMEEIEHLAEHLADELPNPPAQAAQWDEVDVELACKAAAMHADGASFPDAYGDDEAEATREFMRAALRAVWGRASVATQPNSPDAADSGRVAEAAKLAGILNGLHEGGYNIETLYMDDQADGDCFVARAADLLREFAALAAQGQGEKMPVPVSLDRTHKNKAYLTLGFCDEQACSTFFNAISRGRDLYTLPAPPASPAGVPDGWKLVPVKSTDAMHQAYIRAKYDGPKPVLIPNLWAAMLAAAPSAPEGGEESTP